MAVSSVVGIIGRSFFDAIARQIGYLSKYKSNSDDFKKEVEKLKLAREHVQRMVDDAKRNGEQIEEDVEKWLSSVDKIMDEAGRFAEKEERANNRCFTGTCPNLRTRYQLSKRAVREMKDVSGLEEKGKFCKVFVHSIPGEKWLPSDRGYEALESRMSILEDILDGLNNPHVNMIGVYGMAGVGKTTLVKEVARQAKKVKLFDVVAFAWASSTPKIKKIQEEIADQLGLRLWEETESERAGMICDRLTKEKKILVILDDIWTSLDLERIGIPFGDVLRGCKILLTSRHRDVLANKLHSQNNYYVSVLNKEEAWSLFTRTVGDRFEECDWKSVAIQVANECGGLPIAIITVARALRNKSLVEWNAALQKFRSSVTNFKGLDALVYSSLELSYNYLIDQDVRSAFLLCGLMKDPDDASIMDLLKYGMCFDLFEGAYTMQERRDKAYALVRKLKESCLLLDGHTEDCFSMHDIVRDVATSVASRDLHVFTGRDDVQIEWPNKDILKNCTAIFLHDNNTGEIPEGLECPQLTLFCMNPKDHIFQIPDDFFKGMPKLRVLVLTKMKLLSLPSSFHLLLNLETLCLDQCVLGDIAGIGNLNKLEILSLLCSDIEQLPREIGQLAQLKVLDLSNCSKLKVIPPNVISNLSRLEELYMGNTSVKWEFEGLNVERSNVSLQELKHLSHLTTLEIHIQDVLILPKGLFSNKLERYKIFIGDEWDWFGKNENTRMLKLKLCTSIYLDEIIMQLKGIEDLYLDEVPGIKNVLYDLHKEGFPQLKHLHVQNNPFVLCIVDSMAWDCHTFPLLESLVLRNLIHLEKICHGQLKAEWFCKLRSIKVRNCDKLKSIFSFYIARGLPQLQTLAAIKCKNLNEIFTVGKEDNVDYNVVDKVEFSQLRSLTLKFLPQLTSFYSQMKTPATSQKGHSEVTLVEELDTPIPFFNEKVVFPNLETLEFCAISSEKIWFAEVSSCVQNLIRLIVHGCDNLKYLFPSSIVRNFVQLQHLEICSCTALEEIVVEEIGAEATNKFVFPRVTFLKLCNLPELRAFYPGVHTSEWPSIKKLEVCDCEKVKVFTSEFLSFQETSEVDRLPTQQALFSVEKVVPSLEELKLSGKDITIICQGRLPKHLFGKLKILEVVCDKSENFPIGFLQRFHNLEKLELRWNSYKEIFSHGGVEKHAGTLPQIKSLKLWELSDLKYMWKQDSVSNTVVQNLETLEVWWCDNLINLVPSSASFENLITLEVWCCKGLKNLVTTSTAKSLVHLMKLRIDGCKMMTEVISNNGDVAEEEIIFSKLKWLSLEHLESLTSFCSSNFTFKFPSLENLYVIECPKMRSFSSRVSSTPRLQEVLQNWELDKWCWEGDLNTTIQQIHEKKALPLPLPLLPLTDLPSLSTSPGTSADRLSPNLPGSSNTQALPLPLLPLTDLPSLSTSPGTSADKLSPNLPGSSNTQALPLPLLPLTDLPLLSTSPGTSVDKLSRNLPGSSNTQALLLQLHSLTNLASMSTSPGTSAKKLSPNLPGSSNTQLHSQRENRDKESSLIPSTEYDQLSRIDNSFPLESIGEDSVFAERKQILLTNFVPALRSGEWSDIGNRQFMEDTSVCISDLAKTFGNKILGDEAVSFYGVFDGHGGNGAAHFVREQLPRVIVKDADFPLDIEKVVTRSFIETDEALLKSSIESALSSGTTALTAMIFGRSLLVANAGDCRAVLSRRGEAVELSEDHRPNCTKERMRVESLGGYVDDGYLNGVLSVTRALGDWHLEGMKETGGRGGPLSAEPELKLVTLTKEDEFLIIGSDGIWDVFTSQNAVGFARRRLQEHNDLKLCCKEMIEEALKRGTMDNLTVVMVSFHLDPPPQVASRGAQRQFRSSHSGIENFKYLKSIPKGSRSITHVPTHPELV